MTETTHTRSRRASLGGLVLQLAATAGVFALALATDSQGAYQLSFYLLGGMPIWFVALLVFRQRELAALEALDLEELRREKQTAGGGEALFGEGGASGLGFRVAEARLQWMLRWLVPGFGVATALYLTAMGFLLWRRLASRQLIGGVELPALAIGGQGWPEMHNIGVAMVILAIVMLGTFLYSRYTSGMARTPEWQLLRGCGSYMLGNTLVVTSLLVCLGVRQYFGTPEWEQALAFIVPVLMAVLALETLINFVLDIYRPRAPGAEPRACFDSRLLGLIAEPGGIASSIADAINYQFGFQVSQTWFYQLLQRTFLPLVAFGAVAIWLLTCIVVVQPYERVIIERFGRQLNATDPLRPGLHTKLPWPIDVARAYNTGQLHQLSVGFKDPNAALDYSQASAGVQLWTDEKHLGQEHFEFLICPKPDEGRPTASQPLKEIEDSSDAAKAAVWLIRMEAVVQYRIQPDRLDRYSTVMSDPDQALRDIAWEEVGRFAAASTAESLLGRQLGEIGALLRDRIGKRVLNLGLEVVYVGVMNVHPERTVSEAYRAVVKAEQERVSAIREALVTESERLSKVAGDARTARVLANAIERDRKANEAVNDSLQVLATANPEIVQEMLSTLTPLDDLIKRHVEAEARLERARDQRREVEQDFELGLGQTTEARHKAADAVTQAENDERAAAAALAKDVAPLQQAAAARLTPELAEALIQGAEARMARAYWDERLLQVFTPGRLEGEAAARLAAAQADRWTIEMNAARELTQAENERDAYRAAPSIYKARRLMEVLVDGLKDSRKYFLAFDPGARQVRVRIIPEDEVRLEPTELTPGK